MTCDVEFVFYMDNDDPSELPFGIFDFPVQLLRGPRIVLSDMWNKCAEVAKGEIYCQGNDDCVWQTLGWDTQVVEAFHKSTDKILMVHGSDGGPRAELFGPHPFIHRRWLDTLGYFTAPYFSSDFGDTWINDIANVLNRRVYLPFVIEHLHFSFAKAEMDLTTKERLTRHSDDSVDELYRHLGCLRDLDIEKLKAVIDEECDSNGERESGQRDADTRKNEVVHPDSDAAVAGGISAATESGTHAASVRVS